MGHCGTKPWILIVAFSLTFSLLSIPHIAYGQLQTFQPVLPPGWIDRSITMVYRLEHTSDKEAGNHTLLHFSLIEPKNNQTLTNVVYLLRISADKSGTRSLYADIFESSIGSLIIDITYDKNLSSNVVTAGRDQTLDIWTADENGYLKVKSPFIKVGEQYFMDVEVLRAESKGSFYSQDEAPKFDFVLDSQDTVQKVVLPEFSALLPVLILPLSAIIGLRRLGYLSWHG